LLIILGASTGPAAAQGGGVSLEEYLLRGREAGFNLIYGSTLLHASQQLAVDGSQPFSLERLRELLPELGLELTELRPGTWVLRRAEPAPVTPEIHREEPRLEEVVVHSSRYRWQRRLDAPARLGTGELQSRPLFANDALRVINQLPGSASVGMSARPRVRGGRADETLIEYDTVRLYNPFHFASYNSLYSIFDARLVGEIEFFSGAYPLYLGDSLSAAMQLSPPEPGLPGQRRELGVGFYQLSYFHNRVTQDSSLLLNLRRSSPESGQLLESQDLGHPEYGDAYLRYERETSSGRRWSANLLWYGDDLRFGKAQGRESARANYNGGYGWWRVESAAAESLQWSTTVGVAYLESRREGQLREAGKARGELDEDRDLSTLFASQDFETSALSGMLGFGWDYRYLDTSYAVASHRVLDPAFAQLGNIERREWEKLAGRQRVQQGAVYLNWQRPLAERWYLDLGARLDAQRYADRVDAEPAYRVGLLFRPLPSLDLRAVWGRYTQAQALSELPVADLQAAVPEPQVARQIVLALDWSLPGAKLRVEAYDKDATEVSPYFSNLANAFTLLPELQPDRLRIAPEAYSASGIEFGLELPLDAVTLWANYAYSTARDKLDGRFVSRRWDQARTANVGLRTRLGAWDLSVAAAFQEGWLSTDLYQADGELRAAALNGRRYDHFFSLDAKLIRRWPFRAGELRLETGVTNLTDRDNQVGTDYTVQEGELRESAFDGVSRTGFIDLFWAF